MWALLRWINTLVPRPREIQRREHLNGVGVAPGGGQFGAGPVQQYGAQRAPLVDDAAAPPDRANLVRVAIAPGSPAAAAVGCAVEVSGHA